MLIQYILIFDVFLGYAPKSRRLKEDAIIELNLPANLVSTAVESASTINRRNRMETKSLKQVNIKNCIHALILSLYVSTNNI